VHETPRDDKDLERALRAAEGAADGAAASAVVQIARVLTVERLQEKIKGWGKNEPFGIMNKKM